MPDGVAADAARRDAGGAADHGATGAVARKHAHLRGGIAGKAHGTTIATATIDDRHAGVALRIAGLPRTAAVLSAAWAALNAKAGGVADHAHGAGTIGGAIVGGAANRSVR